MVVFKKNRKTWDRYFFQPTGELGRYMHKRGEIITAAAKAQVGVRTGALRASIHMRHFRDTRGQYLRIGSSLPYAYIHHEGTAPHLILPKRQEKLRFVARGAVVYTHLVRHPGTPPNRYLTDNLKYIT